MQGQMKKNTTCADGFEHRARGGDFFSFEFTPLADAGAKLGRGLDEHRFTGEIGHLVECLLRSTKVCFVNLVAEGVQ
jgi:hypothetical protein